MTMKFIVRFLVFKKTVITNILVTFIVIIFTMGKK